MPATPPQKPDAVEIERLEDLQREFRVEAQQIMTRGNYFLLNKDLVAFVQFIRSKPDIYDYIKRCGQSNWNMESAYKISHHNFFPIIDRLGETKEKKVCNIFGFFEFLVDNKKRLAKYVNPRGTCSLWIAGTPKPQIKKIPNENAEVPGIFYEKIMAVLIQYIDLYLDQRLAHLRAEKNDLLPNVIDYALRTRDFDAFFLLLKGLFASSPYSPKEKSKGKIEEASFQRTLQGYLSALPYSVTAEANVAGKRADLVLETPYGIFIFELKRSDNCASAQKAIAQIHASHYAEPYVAQGLPIYLIGLVFDKESLLLVDNAVELYEGTSEV